MLHAVRGAEVGAAVHSRFPSSPSWLILFLFRLQGREAASKLSAIPFCYAEALFPGAMQWNSFDMSVDGPARGWAGICISGCGPRSLGPSNQTSLSSIPVLRHSSTLVELWMTHPGESSPPSGYLQAASGQANSFLALCLGGMFDPRNVPSALRADLQC